MSTLSNDPPACNGVADGEARRDGAVPLARFLDADRRDARLWAYHGPAECPYLTPDDAERAEADSVWAALRDEAN